MADSEAAIEKYLARLCKQNGILCWKLSSPARRGVPDRILFRAGQTLVVEVKAPGKRPTELQATYLKMLADQGIDATFISDRQHADVIVQRLLRKDFTAQR